MINFTKLPSPRKTKTALQTLRNKLRQEDQDIEDKIHYCLQKNPNQWERNFLISIQKQVDRNKLITGFTCLTDKQKEKLDQIYQKLQ